MTNDVTGDLDDRVIVVISGPGGVGKGTIVARLLDSEPGLWLSRSWTTRDRRPGEAMEAYHFTDRERFLAQVEADGFLEWVEFLDYLQGTPVPLPPAGHDVLLEIDVYGAEQVQVRYPQALLIFVKAPSLPEQQARLRRRGDTEERITARLRKGREETNRAKRLGMIEVVNDDLGEAVKKVRSLIEQRRGEASCW